MQHVRAQKRICRVYVHALDVRSDDVRGQSSNYYGSIRKMGDLPRPSEEADASAGPQLYDSGDLSAGGQIYTSTEIGKYFYNGESQ